MDTILNKVRKAVEQLSLGTPFTAKHFSTIAAPQVIDQALSQLTDREIIVRVCDEVFVRPKFSKWVEGPCLPPAHDVAKAIADSQGDVISIAGATAANRFHLSTQVPMREIFLTSGPERFFILKNQKIEMRHAPSEMLVLAGTPAGEALVALLYLGESEVTVSTVKIIKKGLAPEQFTILCSTSTSKPAWLSDLLITAYSQ
jgi:hypothetical protein